MIRNVSLEEISDGRLYSSNDMVKADCGDCRGCSACCRGMGSSIVLDPLDVHRLVNGLGQSFQQLLQGKLELNVEDGIILPNLKMAGEEECCSFLNEEGRCSIHGFRPGICRLFPLGRFYEEENRSFRYFLQVHECRNQNRTKVKVRKWIDTPELARYERFVSDWHYFLKSLQQLLAGADFDEGKAKNISLYLLNEFYMKPFVSGTGQEEGGPASGDTGFYEEFDARLAAAKEACGVR